MTQDLVPYIYRTELPGIPGIDGIRLNYGSWHLLNEALSCFINNEHYACIACLAACLELWLRRTLHSNEKFYRLIKKAEEATIISGLERKELDQIRRTRNMYLHFDHAKLPYSRPRGKTAAFGYRRKLLSLKTHAVKLYEADIDLYPTEAHKDAFPLAVLAVTSYFALNSTIRFFLKRYPRKDGMIDSYWKFLLEKVDGLDDNEVFILLRTSRKAESVKIERFLDSLRRIFKAKA